MKKARPFLKTLTGGSKFKRLLGDGQKLKDLRAGLVVLKPGESVGGHSTEGKEEVLIILKGTAGVYLGGRKVSAKEHSFIYIPPQMHHNVENTGRNLLKYVYITSSCQNSLIEI